MKKIILILSLLIIPSVYAEEAPQEPPAVNPLVVPQNIDYKDCVKIYGTDKEKLFYLALVSLAENKFNIDEIQSTNGYIIFSANKNKYLMTVANIDDNNSVLKITPCNNVYKFPPGIIANTFKYIDLNLTVKI